MRKIIFYCISIVAIFTMILINFINTQVQEVRARMLIPLYMYPSENVWANVVNANVNENIDVIINPDNGSGTFQDTAFTNGVNQLKAGHVGVFGYVITDYGSRSSATVKNEIDKYYEWYHVDGIFLDEASNTASALPYYSDLWLYITTKGMKVILNSGSNTKEDYASISDSIVIYESVVSKNLSVSAWVANYSPSKFAALQYGANAEQMRNFVTLAKMNNIGYIYVTNDIGPNPWDELPPYLAEEAALLWGEPAISGNAGVSGVKLSYMDGTLKTVISQSDGSYSFQVSQEWSGTVVPFHPCYTFTPVQRDYNHVNGDQLSQNYTPNLISNTICILNIIRTSTNPTSASNVDFTITFSKDVTGVDSGDFALSTTGVSGAFITRVTPISASIYSITVNTGSGSGTIHLDVPVSATITDLSSNPLAGLPFISGETYTKSPTFPDVPFNYWASSFVERLFNSGITSGCGNGNYCPTSPVTRAQMAVFLEKGMHGNAFTPSNVSPTFNDTAGHWAEDWIEALKSDAITSGCGNNNYCPEDSVTRAQMAVFLLKAMHGFSYSPPAASPTFGDDAGHWAQNWIEELALEGITSGCGNGNYCPDSPVTRDQMAVFLVKAFGLPL